MTKTLDLDTLYKVPVGKIGAQDIYGTLPMPDDLFTLNRVGELLGYSRGTLSAYQSRGIFPVQALETDDGPRYRWADVENWLLTRPGQGVARAQRARYPDGHLRGSHIPIYDQEPADWMPVSVSQIAKIFGVSAPAIYLAMGKEALAPSPITTEHDSKRAYRWKEVSDWWKARKA